MLFDLISISCVTYHLDVVMRRFLASVIFEQPAAHVSIAGMRLGTRAATGRQPWRAPFWSGVKADLERSHAGPRPERSYGFTSVICQPQYSVTMSGKF